MAKRRTSGIQRRSRASDEALSRKLGQGRRVGLDWRLLTIGGIVGVGGAVLVLVFVLGGIVVLGVAVLVLIFVFGGSGSSSDGGAIGVRQPDDGRNHIPEGTSGGPYHSIPATSGNHWSVAPSATDIGSPGPWGV